VFPLKIKIKMFKANSSKSKLQFIKVSVVNTKVKYQRWNLPNEKLNSNYNYNS